MDWYLAVLRNYAEFNGRARRKEYWMFVLVNLVVSFVIGLVCGLLHVPALSWLYSLAVLVPSIAVGVRRLHDTGRSGWWLLIALVPILGSIALIVFLAQDSQAGDNEFGANPKGGEPAYA